MNNSKSASLRYDSLAPKGIRFFHICSDSIAGALKLTEQQFPGECESLTVKNWLNLLSKLAKCKSLKTTN